MGTIAVAETGSVVAMTACYVPVRLLSAAVCALVHRVSSVVRQEKKIHLFCTDDCFRKVCHFEHY